ncbi:MAG: type II toxin-antitoxin system RelE/ParE family toxin [Chitinispirillia bacterium]|nr:type II toxin-antitoxin system RelE/ParE family toxin [Chitinispirillia bacterium]MCL2241109.1 type II toxin-antitoxin system RelE/ParE family toxin [Chitinispirillia bacterium]
MDYYEPEMTVRAKLDIAEIYRYFYIDKKSSQTAARMVDAFEDAIFNDLPFMAPGCRLVRNAALAARGLRRMNVKAYAVFFTVNENEKIVNIERIIHGSRDLDSILSGDVGA